MTHGGARYNSSGTSCIALSEVVDSLLVIKQLVFDPAEHGRSRSDALGEQDAIDFQALKEAVDRNFGLPCVEDDGVVDVDSGERDRRIYALARYQVDKFGSGDPSAREMAERVVTMIAKIFQDRDNGRGGVYTTGYRSNNNHTVFGRVTEALPCSRLRYQPFTSGLTPAPTTTKNLLDNLIDVGSLDPCLCDNSYTLNVRLSFSKKNTHEQDIERITWYVRSYCDLGGMLIQFNMVDTDTLRDAMAHPEEYPDLIARVAGYTGYYTKMNRDLQLEILGRTEFEL
jgi:formate C-acetyltransferase